MSETPERRACACATPDPVMQADRKFYCQTCSFETGARPVLLEPEQTIALLVMQVDAGLASCAAWEADVERLEAEVARLTEERDKFQHALEDISRVCNAHIDARGLAEAEVARLTADCAAMRDMLRQAEAEEIATLQRENNALAYDKTCLHEDVATLTAERDALQKRTDDLIKVCHESNAVCACGCPDNVHENYGEDGEACENEAHQCIRTSPAVAVMLRQAEAEVARLTANYDAERHRADAFEREVARLTQERDENAALAISLARHLGPGLLG